MPERRNRLRALDGMRFLAAMMVVAYHYVAITGSTGIGSKIWGPGQFKHLLLPTSYGWLGVEFFFLISGFVICMSSWGRSLGDFFISRVVRLYPAYWLAVLATTLFVTLWPTVHTALGARDVITNLTMLEYPLYVPRVDSVYWTLWREMQFYLFFGLVVWKGVTYRRAVMFCLLWTVISFLAQATNVPALVELTDAQYSMYFVAGIAIYLMYRFRPTPLLWGIVAVSWGLAMHYLPDANNWNQELHQPLWPAELIVTLAFILMIGLALGWFNWLNWKGLTTLGSLTYPIYLVHCYIGQNIFGALHRRVPHGVLLVGVTLGMCLVAWLIHRFVEEPLAPRFKRLLARGVEEMRNSGKPATG